MDSRRAARPAATSRPRGHRGGIYPFLRATMCVFVRDLHRLRRDLGHDAKGRPAVYATFSSYDEVAHHSGLERADTLEALRKLDQQFGRIDRAPPLRGAAVRDRRALRPRPDAGRDVQAAQRLRAGRAGRALACATAASPTSSAATSRARWSATRSARRPATKREEAREERRLRAAGGRARLRQPRARLPDGGAPPADARRDRRRATRTCSRRFASIPHVGWLLVRSDRARPGRARRAGVRYLADGSHRRRRPAGALLADGRRASAAHRRLRPRRRHHGRQLLRPAARRRLRVRGADLVPRRHRRPADAAFILYPATLSAARWGRSSARPPFTSSWSPGGDSSTRGLSLCRSRARSRASSVAAS